MHNTSLNKITFVRKTHFNVSFAMLQKKNTTFLHIDGGSLNTEVP